MNQYTSIYLQQRTMCNSGLYSALFTRGWPTFYFQSTDDITIFIKKMIEMRR